jgi:hypothetical protein
MARPCCTVPLPCYVRSPHVFNECSFVTVETELDAAPFHKHMSGKSQESGEESMMLHCFTKLSEINPLVAVKISGTRAADFCV